MDNKEEKNPELFEEDLQQDALEAEAAPAKESFKVEKAPKKRWYVVHTYSGHENKVKVNLEKRIEYMNMSEKIFRVEVPQKTITQVKGGRAGTRPLSLTFACIHTASKADYAVLLVPMAVILQCDDMPPAHCKYNIYFPLF